MWYAEERRADKERRRKSWGGKEKSIEQGEGERKGEELNKDRRGGEGKGEEERRQRKGEETRRGATGTNQE